MTLAEGVDVSEKIAHPPAYMLDQSYRQGRMQPRYAALCAAWEMLDMSSALDMAAIRDSLRRIMEKKNMKPTTLSLLVGTSKTLVKDLLEKTEDVKIGTLVKLAGALDVDVDELLAKPRIPIAGYIGAGGQVIYEDFGETLEADNSVMRPPGISGTLIALAVRGTSMLPKYKDGDIIYIQRQHDGLLPEYIGDDCAIRLVSGETYIKQLTHGTRPGVYTLRSLNAEDMIDQEIEWATPIVFIMPYRARLMMEE